MFLKLKYPGYVPNFTAFHDAQFGEYSSAFTMVTIALVGRIPPPSVGKTTFERPRG